MSIRWNGRPNNPDVGVGNKLFYFFSAVIHRDKYNIKVISDGKGPEKKIKKIVKLINTDNLFYNKEEIPKNVKKTKHVEAIYDKNSNLPFYGNDICHVLCDFYHNTNTIVKNKKTVFSYINIDYYRKQALENINYSIKENDILCCVRLGDFNCGKGNVLNPDYYIDILREISNKKNNILGKIYMCVFNNKPGLIEKYLTYFKEFDHKIVLIEGKDEHHDFYLPFLFKTIIMSNSTFGWWSIFLNTDESCKVYMPDIFEKKPIGGGFCGLPVMHTTSEIRPSQKFKIIL